MTAFPDIAPSYSSALQKDLGVLEARFGDNYSQRAQAGLNNVSESWSLVFENYPDTDIATIDAFLEARGGDEAFEWTAPGELTEKKWTCKSWSKTPSGFQVSTLRATFRREYDL